MNFAPIVEIALPSTSERLTIWAIGDIHLGTRNCDEERLARVVDAIVKNPMARWVSLGDICEFIPPDDKKRFDGRTLAPWITSPDLRTLGWTQLEKAEEYLKPIAGKCLGMVDGNHEDSMTRYYGVPTTSYLAGKWHVPYLQDSGWIPIRVKRKGSDSRLVYTIVAQHGHRGGVTAAGRAGALQHVTNIFDDVDCIMMGHLHHQMSMPTDKLGISKNHCTERMRRVHAMITGAFYKTYVQDSPSYGEKMQYQPSVLGPLAVEVRWTQAGRKQDRLIARVLEPEY